MQDKLVQMITTTTYPKHPNLDQLCRGKHFVSSLP